MNAVLHDITERNQSNVVSLGERRLTACSETVRRQLIENGEIANELAQRLAAHPVAVIEAAIERAVNAHANGLDVRVSINLGIAVADALVDEAFKPGSAEAAWRNYENARQAKRISDAMRNDGPEAA